ncbi:ubiquitin carboxyl terminal hydrolase 4 [Echinococcus multilocularis]|uniref:ubiquitinyl hydrolase 1 n=1 Tax=Echinococcus multilocularis TaxID=6211 RepID=A0A087VXP9_ECHMU|nr:ubiquitin carboxyl terminal hydrolase 4 [Echinococcus multilocularis]
MHLPNFICRCMYYQPSKNKRLQVSSVESTSSCVNSDEFQLFIRDNTSPYPPGLTNLGNTCYINATLQCLLTIQPLVDWLVSQPEKHFLQNPQSEGPLLTPVLSKLVVAIFRNDYDSELKEFRQVIGELVKDFKEPQEQDAQEFLLFLLNRLHDETAQKPTGRGPSTSEILRIFEGTLQTHLIYPQHKPKPRLSKSFFNESKSNLEVFLSLSIPIPLPGNHLKAATDLLDSNPCDLNIVFNEIRAHNSSICFRRLLKVHPSTDIQSVYNQVLSFPSISSGTAPKSSHTTGGGSYRDSKKSTIEDLSSSSSSTSDLFILLQVKSTGFGDWFLESSGRAVDLIDGLNMEDVFFTNSHVMSESVKRSLLSGDALFIVRLNNKLSAEEPPLTSPSSCLDKNGISDVEAGKQVLDSASSSTVESRMQLLLVHVEEHKNRTFFRSPSNDNNAARAESFRRFSPPLSVNVPNDICFDSLRLLALQSLLVFCGNRTPTGSMLTSEVYRSVYFWVVDAAPGEPCEIDSRQEFPLLHSTIEVSSIPLPKWLSTENGDSPRLLRLLVVWSSPPIDPLPTFKVDTDLPLRDFLADPNVTSVCNSRLAGSNNLEDSYFTIEKCLEAFIETANVTRTQPCDTSAKQHTTVLLNTRLEKAPKYLLLHLNRFVYVPASSGGNVLMKINSLVKYPTNNLDLSFMFDQSKSKRNRKSKNSSNNDSGKPVYELVAVCNHKGSIETGHITAYCKSLISGQWWHYNDLKVHKVSPDQVVQPGAYILFYKKCDADVGNIQKTWEKLFKIATEGRDCQAASRSSSSAPSFTGKRRLSQHHGNNFV